MNNDTLLKNEGMQILSDKLGPVRAERFIALMIRESFNYTEWQRGLFKDVSLETFLHDAMASRLAERSVE